MTCSHIRLELFAQCFSQDHGVKEDSRLSNFRLFQIFICTCEHQIRNTESQNIVRFFKHLFSKRIVVVQVFAHTYKLRALTGEYIRFHVS